MVASQQLQQQKKVESLLVVLALLIRQHASVVMFGRRTETSQGILEKSRPVRDVCNIAAANKYAVGKGWLPENLLSHDSLLNSA